MHKSVEEYKKFLETDEGKASIQAFIDEMNREAKLEKELVSTDVYVKWLENFTKDHPNFSSDQWLYRSDEISKEDNEKVDMLCKFFSGIEKYADAHYIYFTPCDWGGYYSIGYNGKVYEIGLLVGQGAVNFCRTSDINEKAYVIPFEEIANPSEKTRIRTAQIENQLGKIDVVLKELFKSKLQIPIDAIVNRTEKVLEELRKEKKE